MNKSSSLARFSSVAIMVAGLGWLGYLMATSLTNPSLLLPASWFWLGIASALVVMATATNGILFYFFLATGGQLRYPLTMVLNLHFSAQLLRYLPGRFWGVVYQIGAAQGRIPAVRLARANMDWMALSVLGSSLIALLLLGYKQAWAAHQLVSLAMAGVAMIGLVFLGGANWLLKLPAAMLPAKAQRILHGLADSHISPGQLVRVSLWFILSWALYLQGWILLGQAFPLFSQADMVTLCAFYTLASVLGILSAITPAGLGIREAAFVMLAAGSQGTDVAAFLALFGRIWLMVLELVLLAVPLGIQLFHRSATR